MLGVLLGLFPVSVSDQTSVIYVPNQSHASQHVSQAAGIPYWRLNWHNTRSGWWSSTMWKHIKGDTLSCPAKQYLGSPCNDIAWNVAARPPMYIWNTISISQFQNKTAVIIWYTSILTWSRVCVSSLWVPSLLRIYLTTYKQCMFMRTQLWTKYMTLHNDTGGILSQQTTLVIKIKGKKKNVIMRNHIKKTIMTML